MSGEIQGTYTVVTDATGEIVGGGDLTHTFAGTPIDISNKSYGDNVTYLDGELAGKQHVFAGDFTYNNDAQYRAMRDAAFSGTQIELTLTYVGSGGVAGTDESFTGMFVPTGLSDTIPMGAKVSTTISYNSSGIVVRVPPTDA